MKHLFYILFCIYSCQSYSAANIQEMFEPLLKLQHEGMLDGTVLIAKGSKEVFILNHSDDGSSLQRQYYLASTGKQMSAIALLKALYEQSDGNSEKMRAEQVKLKLNQPILHFLPADDKIWHDQVPE